ncbi:unnamed protein product, partial [Porites evermanni]
MFATAVLLFLIRTVTSCQESRCNGTSSLPNARLIGRAFLVQEAKNMGDCIDICDKLSQCRSINFNWVHFLCELNKADVHIAPQSLITSKGFVYLDNPWIKFQLVSCGKTSCAHIQQLVPDAKSGYYRVHIKGTKAQVYCDMDNYGGGWTLVASISSSSNDHLLRAEVNCYNSTRCVEFELTNTSIPCRKLSDPDIHEIATQEGIYLVMRAYNVLLFTALQIPGGVRQFNSECYTYSCPRIIVSHVYPYQWESNCRGVLNGYPI